MSSLIPAQEPDPSLTLSRTSSSDGRGPRATDSTRAEPGEWRVAERQQIMRARVDETLGQFVDEQVRYMAQISPNLVDMGAAIAELISGGKRLRPAFCLWAYIGVGGQDLDGAIRAASSLELVQACALIHDDVMDASDTRRGRPAVHRRFATMHEEGKWRGDPERFGNAAAILAGDLCLSWADDLFCGSGLDASALTRARPWYDRMRTEVMCGQYLDLLEQVAGVGSPEAAVTVVDFKTVKYTTERPLQIGAALAGAELDLVSDLTRYGLPLGEAFQFRDDILGVFGDPAVTGKPAGDDLREGKRTLLLALAAQQATAGQAAVLAGVGDPELDATGIADLREVIVATGALAQLESRISELVSAALAALESLALAPDAREALRRLALAATDRKV